MSYLRPAQFECLKGDCPLSCCCGWRIGLDEGTERLWHSSAQSMRQTWFAALDCVGPDDYQVCLLGQDEAGCCRLMDGDGLCTPHRQQGIEYKPETCRNFPVISLSTEATPTSLSLACPEAGRLLMVIEGDYSGAWYELVQLRDYATALYVDWHEEDSHADRRLQDWLSSAIPAPAWMISPPQGLDGNVQQRLAALDEAGREVLRRYFRQTALHLGLPDQPYGGDAIASTVQLMVLLLALLLSLSHCRQQGHALDDAAIGLVIAHLERQWGHPSSGIALIQEQPWLAQLDWREPLLDQLVEALDDG